MPKPAGANDSKDHASRTDTGRTYDRSVKIADPGGATLDNPHPTSPFVDPNPMGQMLGPKWEKRSR